METITNSTRRRRKNNIENIENEDPDDLKPSLNEKEVDLSDDGKINGVSASTLSFPEVNLESPKVKKKRKEIEKVLNSKPIDRARLRQLALSEGGLVSDDLRRQAWPLLLDLDEESITKAPSQEEFENHPEYKQVVMDVNRSLKRFPPGIPYEQRVALQDQLTRLILRVIMKYPHLCYYQGYHDVAVTFLLVVGEDAAFSILEKLSTEHLRECMEPTMDTTSRLLNTIYPLIYRENSQLAEHMEQSEVGTLFCLPWFLTWFGHSLSQYTNVVRLYDFFLCSPPRMPLYVTAAIVLYRTDQLLQTPCQMDCMHHNLSKLPDDLPFENLLKHASKMYFNYPPERIESEVEERTKRELEQRLNPGKAVIKKRALPPENQRILDKCRRILPRARPRNYFQLIAATASIAFSIYMYMRYSPDAFSITS